MVKEFKEKMITINLRRVFDKPSTKRAKSALFILKKAVRKETRMDNIKISNQVNEELWQNGLFKSIRKITVKVIPDKEFIRVLMPKEKFVVKEEKKEKKGLKEKLDEKKEALTNKPPVETKNTEKKEEPKENKKVETQKEIPKTDAKKNPKDDKKKNTTNKDSKK
jgi:ribosomal protein L31E